MTDFLRLTYVYLCRPAMTMTYLKTFFLVLFWSLWGTLLSQINPPDFICVSRDTLFWNLPTNSCGPFQSFDIYASNDRNGPYALLASISDPLATSFHHPVSDSTYYYILSNHDCPAEVPVSSDTLDNVTIAPTQIEVVTVESDGVHIRWLPNLDPKTDGYLIYKITPQGTLPIDTVMGKFTTSYIDVNSDAHRRSETYYVVAIDRCGNAGLFGDAHNTIFLEAEVDFCENFMQLTWNPYINWTQGVESVEIWIGLNGQPLQFEHRVQQTDTLAYIANIDDGRHYCVAIIYKEANTGIESMSNVQCFTSDVINTLDDLAIRNVSVNTNGSIDITWLRTDSANVDTLMLLRGTSLTDLSPIGDLLDPNPEPNNISRDISAMTSSEQYFYQISAVDDCGTSIVSNHMSSVLLQAQQSPSASELQWTPFEATGRVVIRQDICRAVSGMAGVIIGSVGPGSTTYADISGNDVVGTACYVIKVVHSLGDGSDTLVARSNQACTTPMTGVYIPNVIVPGGLNNIFIPQFTNQNVNFDDYKFSIYNRWGGLVFSTQNYREPWDGTHGGTLLPEGVYLYTLEFTQVGSTPVQMAGSVTLLQGF